MKLRRIALLVAAAIAVCAVGIVAYREAEPGCRTGGHGATAEAALHDYYAECRAKLHVIDFGDGDPGSAGLTAWHAMREFSVDYGHKTRFVIVGQLAPGRQWEVIGGENTGP